VAIEDRALITSREEPLAKLYQNRFSSEKSYRNSVWSILCRQVFSRYVPGDAEVLDLGAGWGEFISNIEASRKYALDLNPDTGKHLAPDVSFLRQDSSQPWPLAAESLDVVFTSNFLEHLPGKRHVEEAVAEAFRCLKPGGTLICLGPNIRFLAGDYWDFWDHHLPISDLSLAELLRYSGFTVERGVARFLPYSMSRRGRPPLFLIGLYLRLPVLWPFFGKQFLIVARKPAAAAKEE
jgi:SAM-dependent methyltransferase